MFQPSTPDAAASCFLASPSNTPSPSTSIPAILQLPPFQPEPGHDPNYELVRHMVFGSPRAVQSTIERLYKLNYAEPHSWSKPMPTGRSNEVMVILSKRLRRST